MTPNRLAAAIFALGLTLPVGARHDTLQAASRELDGWAVAAFTLTDQNGADFTQERLRGRWTFVLFGDTTACAQPCDAALAALAGLSRRIAPADAMKTTQILFISLDPRRDTPARLREYLARFDPRFVGGTAAAATLRRLTDDLGAGTVGPADNNGAPPNYRGSLLLVGPDVTIRAEYLPPLDARRLTASYLRARQGSR